MLSNSPDLSTSAENPMRTGGAGADFVGKTLKAISFNTTRGGKVPGDDIYKAYDVVFQQP